MTSAKQALGTLIWASFVDSGLGVEQAELFDASPELVSFIETEWKAFTESLPDDFDPEEAVLRVPAEPGWNAWDQMAHDWILTRNHHGCGFWEKSDWAEPWSSLLTKLAQGKPEISLYLNEQSELCPL